RGRHGAPRLHRQRDRPQARHRRSGRSVRRRRRSRARGSPYSRPAQLCRGPAADRAWPATRLTARPHAGRRHIAADARRGRERAADGDHTERGARLAHQALGRLRYPARLRAYVTRLVRSHAFSLKDVDERFARRFLRDHGDELAFDLVAHKEADLRGKRVPQAELDAAARLRRLLEQEQTQPHRLEDLAVDGSDLLELGYSEGPRLGRTLDSLLDAVVDEPALNTREQLLARARAHVA